MYKSKRIENMLARQRKHLLRDTLFVAIMIATTAIGLGAIVL